MLTKTEAVVLRTVKYGDQKMIVDMLTEEFGRLSFAVRPSTSRLRCNTFARCVCCCPTPL